MNDGVHLNPVKPPSAFRDRLKRVWKKDKEPNGSFQQQLNQEQGKKKKKSAQLAEENKEPSAGQMALAHPGKEGDPDRPQAATGSQIDIRA